MFDAASRSKFAITSSSGDLDYAHVVDEVIRETHNNCGNEYCIKKGMLNEFIDEFDGNVDLSSFRPQRELNPKIWPNGILNSKVRLRLLDIADTFIKELKVDWVKPVDIILTGSLANYNWSKFSDFDLHVLIDFDKVDKRTDFVKEYFDAKKNAWNNTHDELKIYGFPVELYVQNIKEKHTATGIYSLEKNKWLVKPERNNIKAIMLNKYFIKSKVTKFCNLIEDLEEALNKEKDNHKIWEIGVKVKKLWDKIKGIRKEGLAKNGEMSSGNIIYKSLRRLEYLEKLLDLKSKTYDKLKSIE